MSQKGSIFDKLTDPSKYTGTHKNRFDESGKGRGIEGRSDRVELDGYVDGFKKKKPTKKTAAKETAIVDRLTDPKKYTGTHKLRFDENGAGKGKEGRVDRVELDGYVDGYKKLQRSASSPTSPKSTSSTSSNGSSVKKSPSGKGSSIFDKLTDPKLYTGSHKSRFDTEGKGLGINQIQDKGAITDLKDITRPEFKSPSKIAKSPSDGSPQKKTATKSSTTPTKSKSSQPKSGASIFDKLTDPKQYTGSHKHRFDAEGKGRGKAGRADLAETDGYVHGYKNKDSYSKP